MEIYHRFNDAEVTSISYSMGTGQCEFKFHDFSCSTATFMSIGEFEF